MRVINLIAVLLCLSFLSVPGWAQGNDVVFNGNAPVADLSSSLRSVVFPAAALPERAGRAAAVKPVSWRGNLCGNAGCTIWNSDSGINLQATACGNSGCWAWYSNTGAKWDCRPGSFHNAGCREWTSNLGLAWSCASNPYGNAGCNEWRSNTGVIWSCEINSFGNAGCNSWKSNIGLSWKGGVNTCSNSGCTAWNASAPDDTFLPFFVQLYYDALHREKGADKYVPGYDENGFGEIPCSQSGMTWQTTEIERRVMEKQGSDLYVCDFSVQWDHNWKNCKEAHPKTNPGVCSCKAASRKGSAQNTGRCVWEAK